MNTKVILALAGLSAIAFLSGCNLGMQPQGPSVAEIQAKEASLPPDQQISMIQHSPMPPAEKEKRIAEIKSKYNIKD